MSTVHIVGVVIGVLVIAVTIWQIAKHGIAKSNGRVPEADGNWSDGAP